MRAVIVGVLVLGTVLASASVALAGWFWNAQLNVEGTDTRVRWSVDGVPDEDAAGFRSQIMVWVPKGADASLVDRLTDAENVVILEDKGLACNAKSVEVRAQVRVLPVRGTAGTSANVQLLAAGAVVGSGTGAVRDAIEVSGLIPASSPSCSSGG